MIGSFLTRGLVMIFGYVYPAYECFKTVEKNKPEIEELRFWCQYWILVALLTVFERVGDAFVSWVPMYSEAKLAFYIYLWYPKTMGTTYVYDSFFRPYIVKHEPDIDRNLLELRTRAGDYVLLYWQRAASYGQTRVFDILQYVAAQSTPIARPSPVQPQQQSDVRLVQPAAPTTRQIASSPPSPSASSASNQHQKDVAEKDKTPEAPAAPPPSKTPQKPSANPSVTESSSSSSQPASSEAESSMQVDSAPTTGIVTATSLPKETALEETFRDIRLRLRKNRSGSVPK